jgi:acylphosphatase
MNRAVNIVVCGRVQGVGFRYFALQQAQHVGITGYVKNLIDGRVEIEAEGSQEAVESYINILRAGPVYGNVEDIIITELPFEGRYSKFSINY